MEWILDIALIGLLTATLLHAVRLQRALGVLRRDRAALEQLVAGFNASTRQAESGVERLRTALDGAGRQIARQTEAATALKGDLELLIERGEHLANDLDRRVRNGRSAAGGHCEQAPAEAEIVEPERVRSQAERDLIRALKLAR
jgi:hypothetical protein